MMSLAIWSVFGGILGLLWGLLENRDVQRDSIRHIVAGAGGGAFGGFLAQWDATPAALTASSVMTASLGAVAFSALVGWLAKSGIHRVRDRTP